MLPDLALAAASRPKHGLGHPSAWSAQHHGTRFRTSSPL